MDESSNIAAKPVPNWRLKLGIGIFLLSIVLPIAGIPLVSSLGFSTALAASLTGVLFVGAEVLGVTAVAVMGKPGYVLIKQRILGYLKRYRPPKVVSRTRYNVGLVMFSVPILFGWLVPYWDELIPGYVNHPVLYAIVGDMLLVASLFVLGGEFWDKLRGLFVYSDKICSSQQHASFDESI